MVRDLCDRILDYFTEVTSEQGPAGVPLRGNERTYFIVKTLEVFSMKHMKDDGFPFCPFDGYLHSVKLYFQGVLNPLISFQEIKYFLVVALHMSPHDADVICQEIKGLFPEVRDVYQPRSLMHICRYRIRADLVNRNVPLVELVQNVPIPPSIKTLILIGDCDRFLL